ncbi:hypothetical protein [Aquimarina sp. 2304DJ70-9]|uniref:hypothetical protein n=1 Tax=Aquimarina penaris TaxID=3231044 RepID=UPI003461B8F7
MTNNQDPIGKWVMVVGNGTMITPSVFFEEITENSIKIYHFDEEKSSFPLKIDTKNRQMITNDTYRIDYELISDNLLKEKHTYNGKNTETHFVRLHPTIINLPIEEAIKKQYIMYAKDAPGNMRDQIFDLSNLNVSQSIDLHIQKILGTHFMIATYGRKKTWLFPIKEIGINYLLIYGFSLSNSFIKLDEFIPKKQPITKGESDVFFEPKLNLLIDELNRHRTNISNELNVALEDKNYLVAHYLADSYAKTNKKFNALSTIKNKNHPEIIWNEQILERTKQRLKSEDTVDYLKDSLLNYIEVYEKKIQRFKEEKIKQTSMSNQLKNAIIELLNCKIQNIRLILKEKYSTTLNISINKNELVLVLQCDGNERFLDCNFTVLKSLGFIEKEKDYIYGIQKFEIDKIDIVLTLLSRFVFDAFYFESLDSPLKLLISKN